MCKKWLTGTWKIKPMQRKHLPILAALLLIVLLSSACQPALTEGWERVESESLGLSITMPEDWVVSYEDGALFLGSTQSAMDSKDFQEEAAVSITTATLSDLNDASTPEEIVETFMIPFNHTVEGLVVTQEITSLTLQDHPAANTAFEGVINENFGFYTFTAVVIEPEQSALMIFTADASADGHFADILAEIVASVTLK